MPWREAVAAGSFFNQLINVAPGAAELALLDQLVPDLDLQVAPAPAHSTPNLNIGQCRIQVQQVQLAEWNRYTLGPPCMVFKNPTETKAYMRALLMGSGFDSVGIPPISSRQFRFRAFKNGTQVVGVVAKTGKRQLIVKKWFASGPVRTSAVTTPFEA